MTICEKIDKPKFSDIVALMKFRKMFAMSAAILLALLFFASTARSTFAQDPGCIEAASNLLHDCGFVDFYGNEGAGSGVWKIAKLSGTVGIGLHESDAWPKGPSVWFKADAPFDGVIFQQVRVTPGKGYHFTLPYAVVNLNGKGWSEDNQVNRRLGIDSFGGTDPNSPNIKWTPDYFGKAKVTESIDLDEYARAETITVFIRVINPYTDRHVDVFVDSPALMENTSMAPLQVSAPSVTPPPAPPAKILPTAQPTIANEPTQAPTAEPQPTEIPPTEMAAVEPSATEIAPTTAPRATRTRVAQARPARTRIAVSQSTSAASSALSQDSVIQFGILGALGLFGLITALVLVGAAAFLLLRRK